MQTRKIMINEKSIDPMKAAKCRKKNVIKPPVISKKNHWKTIKAQTARFAFYL